ncbi:hypothetical protein ABI59_08645 [Acidobacteria bacterium Mor1]|nr:hypothetical protein ABI59_08645 [Acidobacteria bacterium Mor1]
MQYTPWVPQSEPLAACIDTMFVLENYRPEHARERIVPDATVTLVMELDGRPRHVYEPGTDRIRQTFRGAWLSGVHRHFITIGDTNFDSTLMATRFKLGGARPLLPADLEDLNDRVVPAEELFGDAIHRLRDEILAQEDSAARLARMACFWEGRHDPEQQPPEAAATAVATLVESPAEVSIADLAHHAAVSPKHLLTLFRRHVGPTPKQLQRILRFYRVFERLQAGQVQDWAELSLELGYADQSHFIREFTRFSGYRPAEFARRDSDRPNFFPEDDGDGR